MTQQTASYDNVPVYTGMPVPQDNNGFFQPPAPSAGAGHALASIDEFRAIAEVQASMALAKRFPRDEFAAYTRIMNACKRKSLAESAIYKSQRGKKEDPKTGKLVKNYVNGPSIRLAEVLANAWGNIDYGYREVGSGPGYTDVEAFAFDKESNSRSCRTFRVAHKRKSGKDLIDLTDPRDVYELVANQASRRIRSCILQIIPGDVTEAALKACAETKETGQGPIEDRIRAMLLKFQEFGVTADMLEHRLGHDLSLTTHAEISECINIYNALKDGEARREEFFDLVAASPEGGRKPAQAKEEQPKQEKKVPAQNPPAAKTTPAPGKKGGTANAAEKTEAAPKQTTRPASGPGMMTNAPQEDPPLTHDPETREVFGKAANLVTCPKNGKRVDEWECVEKPCHDGCPEFK